MCIRAEDPKHKQRLIKTYSLSLSHTHHTTHSTFYTQHNTSAKCQHTPFQLFESRAEALHNHNVARDVQCWQHGRASNLGVCILVLERRSLVAHGRFARLCLHERKCGIRPNALLRSPAKNCILMTNKKQEPKCKTKIKGRIQNMTM